jgi:hypothetical protein
MTLTGENRSTSRITCSSNNLSIKKSRTDYTGNEIRSLWWKAGDKVPVPWHTCLKRPPDITVLTYLLTPWSRILLQKLTVFQLVKKFPTFYGTRRFIKEFTSARHLSLSWASSIQSITLHPTTWRSFLILSAHLRLGLPWWPDINI